MRNLRHGPDSGRRGSRIIEISIRDRRNVHVPVKSQVVGDCRHILTDRTTCFVVGYGKQRGWHGVNWHDIGLSSAETDFVIVHRVYVPQGIADGVKQRLIDCGHGFCNTSA